MRRLLGEDAAAWRSYQLPWLETFEKILQENGHDDALLEQLRKRMAEL